MNVDHRHFAQAVVCVDVDAADKSPVVIPSPDQLSRREMMMMSGEREITGDSTRLSRSNEAIESW